MTIFSASASISTKIRLTKDFFVDTWIRSAASACHGKKAPTILLTVISAPIHIKEREAIRNAWGKLAAKHDQVWKARPF
jgi:hypothetical protein